MAIILVCEGPSDARHLTAMVTAILREKVDWFEPEHCPFQGLTASDRFFPWTSVDQEHSRRFPKGFGVVPMGHFAGMPALPYARRARKTLQVLAKENFDETDGFVLVCDEDLHDSQRLDGLRQAREASSLKAWTAVGVAAPKIEAWILAGFDARSEQEKSRIISERDYLSLDPTREPHRLRDQAGAPRDIKRVLDVVTDADHEREAEAASNLARIRLHGSETGAIEFLSECLERLAPLFDPTPT